MSLRHTLTSRIRAYAMLGVAGALATSAALLTSAPATARAQQHPLVHGGVVAPVEPATGRGRILYSQNDNDAGNGIVSQHFARDSNFYTSRGADDFTIGSGSWKIREVDVTGLYRDDDRATSENVAFYVDKDGLPGAVLARFDRVVGNGNGSGSFNIPLGNGITLPAGTYWVSVQINEPEGFWVWETTSQQHGAAAAWKNPRGGFGSGCRQFADMQDCVGDLGEGPDFMFLLQGSILS